MKPIFQFTGILLVGAVVIISTILLANLIKEPEVVEKIVEKPVTLKAPECPEDFRVYQELIEKGQSIQLLENARSYASQERFAKDYEITLNRSGDDEIACGYLYVRAAKNGESLDKKYDSIYVNPQGLGGHILRPKSISIINPIQNTTEILLQLRSVSYLPNIPYQPDAQNYRVTNWVKLLNAVDQIVFHVGLSTQDVRGIIEDLRIAYKCWNPEIGEETRGCQLSITQTSY